MDLMICYYCGYSGEREEKCPSCSTKTPRNQMERESLREYSRGKLSPLCVAVAKELGAPFSDVVEASNAQGT